MIRQKLEAFFQTAPREVKGGYEYVLIEQEHGYSVTTENDDHESVISLRFNEENEVWIAWKQDGRQITTIERAGIGHVAMIREDDEELLQLVLERWSSRMLQVQLKPYFAIELSLYWEACEECEE